MPTQMAPEPPASMVHAASEFTYELEERFVRYARIDTQSDEKSTTSPSTEKPYELLRLLVDELTSNGAHDVKLTEYGAALATIPASTKTDAPTIALLAHVDTAPQFSGTGVKPIVHRTYSGGDIVLPDDPAIVLSPARFPYLAAKVGEDIITASGTRLLGADDKAGVAIVMNVARHLLQNPGLQHGPIRFCFTANRRLELTCSGAQRVLDAPAVTARAHFYFIQSARPRISLLTGVRRRRAVVLPRTHKSRARHNI